MCGSPAAAKLVLDSVHAAGSITTSHGLTLLHAAALGGQPAAILQQLVQRGCSPTAADKYQHSAMHFAALGGCVETMKFILANGGSMTEKDVVGTTARMYAADPKLTTNHLLTYILFNSNADFSVLYPGTWFADPTADTIHRGLIERYDWSTSTKKNTAGMRLKIKLPR